MAAEVMDGEVVRRWFAIACDALERTRSAIDLLNVFPVADADTGTNLHRTIASAAGALADLPTHASPAEVWHVAATAALRGACGNSGIIVSALLRGLADICGPASPCDGQVVAVAFGNAAVLARAAVHRPVEGTVLTAADAAARAAARASGLAEVGRAAALGARQTLARHAPSGMVDAGAAGLCVVLDALSAAISGAQPGAYEVPAPSDGYSGVAVAEHGDGDGGPVSPHDYEVTFLLDAPESAIARLRDSLDQLGDSLVVSGSWRQWHVHVHAADAGAVVEAGLEAGRLSTITITYLQVPQAGRRAERPALAHQIVAVAEGAGLKRLLGQVEATVVDRAATHSVPDLLIDIARLPGPRALVAPSDLAPCWRERWPVIEVDSVIQVVAALAVHDPRRDQDDDAAAMRRAVAGMRYASVRLGDEADGAGPAGGGPDGGGTFIGLVGDQVMARGSEQAAVAIAVTDLLLATGTELITILTGKGAAPGLGDLTAAHVRAVAPDVEVVCYDGGMTSAAVLIGAE